IIHHQSSTINPPPSIINHQSSTLSVFLPTVAQQVMQQSDKVEVFNVSTSGTRHHQPFPSGKHNFWLSSNQQSLM
ncbi:MAG: hypothetical protein IKV67_08580, partial [Paludibacteraceae bacterium]|nr:hypothetical protein [Paludibacteraceae bacterium]